MTMASRRWKGGGQACAAINCSNSRNKQPHLSFFTFPKDHERSKQWVVNVRREGLEKLTPQQLHVSYVLCANHFEDTQFMNPSAVRKSLIHNALPTLFEIPNPPKTVTPSRPPPKQRKLTSTHASTIISSLSDATPSTSNLTQTLPDTPTKLKKKVAALQKTVTRKNEKINQRSMRIIKRSAVPSKFDFSKKAKQRKRIKYEFGTSVAAPRGEIPSVKSVGMQTEMTMDDIANLIQAVTGQDKKTVVNLEEAVISDNPFSHCLGILSAVEMDLGEKHREELNVGSDAHTQTGMKISSLKDNDVDSDVKLENCSDSEDYGFVKSEILEEVTCPSNSCTTGNNVIGMDLNMTVSFEADNSPVEDDLKRNSDILREAETCASLSDGVSGNCRVKSDILCEPDAISSRFSSNVKTEIQSTCADDSAPPSSSMEIDTVKSECSFDAEEHSPSVKKAAYAESVSMPQSAGVFKRPSTIPSPRSTIVKMANTWRRRTLQSPTALLELRERITSINVIDLTERVS